MVTSVELDYIADRSVTETARRLGKKLTKVALPMAQLAADADMKHLDTCTEFHNSRHDSQRLLVLTRVGFGMLQNLRVLTVGHVVDFNLKFIDAVSAQLEDLHLNNIGKAADTWDLSHFSRLTSLGLSFVEASKIRLVSLYYTLETLNLESMQQQIDDWETLPTPFTAFSRLRNLSLCMSEDFTYEMLALLPPTMRKLAVFTAHEFKGEHITAGWAGLHELSVTLRHAGNEQLTVLSAADLAPLKLLTVLEGLQLCFASDALDSLPSLERLSCKAHPLTQSSLM